MRYYEVLLADSKYHGNTPLTYSSEEELPILSVVTIPLRNRSVSGFIVSEVDKPGFAVKPIKKLMSEKPLPFHCLQLAQWMENYYQSSLGEALRQFAPTKPTIRNLKPEAEAGFSAPAQLELKSPLTTEQKNAIKATLGSASTTIILHGETGSGKTRVYLEMAKKTLADGKSVILLTPEISLTTQLANAAASYLERKPLILHSQLSAAQRKRLWFKALESSEPLIIVGPRSALFTPLAAVGLIVIDEAHEPAYKQEQAPRYNALRVASQLGTYTGAKVIMGTATPNIADYYVAEQKNAVVRMSQQATGNHAQDVTIEVVDLKNRKHFSKSPYLSNQLIDAINETLLNKKQAIIYLNRRGSARIILCGVCGWQFLCPNCDVSLVYHADEHLARCHICGFSHTPPTACLKCNNPDIIYKTIGTKALAEQVAKHFPDKKIRRFDSDNQAGEGLNDVYAELLSGKVDILVGTQLLAKGLDLPRLGLVGIVSAESSLALPDYTAEERTFQLLYQVIGRVGRGHAKGKVIVQTYEPDSLVIQSAINRDFASFYKHSLTERQQFRFPPFSYLLKLVCRRATLAGAQNASHRLRQQLLELNLPVEVIGPTPSFYARRGKYYYYQLVAKSKDRANLVKLAQTVPADWQIDLDPINLL